MLQQVLRVALGLALFRGGPADMPFSLPLPRWSMAFAIVATTLMLSPVAALPMALATGIGSAIGLAFFMRQLLRGKKLDNRYPQAVSAQLVVGGLFALLLWPAVMAMAPAMQEMMEAMRAAMSGAGADGDALGTSMAVARNAKLQPPLWTQLMFDVVFVWSLLVGVRINRLAADLSTPSSWALTVLSMFVLTGFVMLAQIIAAIFLN